MTEVLFFFDTEDYVNEASTGAAIRLAQILTQEGVTGHFAVVGLLAQRWMETGRQDAIEALSRHEIGTHTYGHSLHPTICEMSEGADYKAAYERVAQSEGEGLRLIRQAFRREEILFAVPPGNSKSYVSMYYYSRMGIPFYCDSVVGDLVGSDAHCANMQHIQYTTAIETEFAYGHGENLAEILDKYAQYKRIIIYTHPNMGVFREFPDKRNFYRENLHTPGDYVPSPPRSPEETAEYFARFRRLVQTLKADARFEITTLRQIQARQKPRQVVKAEDMPRIYAHLARDFGPMAEPSLCLYDLLMAEAAFLNGEKAYMPGYAYGMLEEGPELHEAVTLSAQGIRQAAAALPRDGFLPPVCTADGVTLSMGDLLYAMAELLIHPAETVALTPHPAMTLLDRHPQLRDMAIAGTWNHSPDFKDEYFSRRLRLQAFTIR